MDAASSTSRPRRLMRVATIFTGVAAATAGVTQVANAQGIRPAGTQGIRPGNAARPDGAIYGSIRSALSCGHNGSHKTWLHVSTTSYFFAAHYYRSICFGNKGDFESPPYTGIRAECGGNNHGSLLGTNGGHSKIFAFGPGTTYHALGWSHLYTVAINSWTGNDTCPQIPNYGGGGSS
jgi:hypothetical protein